MDVTEPSTNRRNTPTLWHTMAILYFRDREVAGPVHKALAFILGTEIILGTLWASPGAIALRDGGVRLQATRAATILEIVFD